MGEELFRKKSLEKISSPDQLDSCVKVTKGGLWIFLIAVIFLLVGFSTWGILGKLKSYVYGVASVEKEKISIYFDSNDYSLIKTGQICHLEGVNFTIEAPFQEAIKIEEGTEAYVAVLGGFYKGEYVNVVYLENEGIKDGVYTCKVEVAELPPFSFLFN